MQNKDSTGCQNSSTEIVREREPTVRLMVGEKDNPLPLSDTSKNSNNTAGNNPVTSFLRRRFRRRSSSADRKSSTSRSPSAKKSSIMSNQAFKKGSKTLSVNGCRLEKGKSPGEESESRVSKKSQDQVSKTTGATLSEKVLIMQDILRFLQLLCENHNLDLQVNIFPFSVIWNKEVCDRHLIVIHDFCFVCRIS